MRRFISGLFVLCLLSLPAHGQGLPFPGPGLAAACTQLGNDSFTKILLHFNGTNGSSTITDSNAGGSAHTWTATTSTLDTGQFKFATASLNNGSSAVLQYVDTPDSSDFTLGGGDFTIEAWVYRNGGDGTFRAISDQSSVITANRSYALYITSGNVFNLQVTTDGSTATNVTGTTTITTTGWHHVAGVRTGNTLKLFVDGTQEGGDVAFASSVFNSAEVYRVGDFGNPTSTNSWNGWIDEYRLSVGVARWTSNFTPPAAQYCP